MPTIYCAYDNDKRLIFEAESEDLCIRLLIDRVSQLNIMPWEITKVMVDSKHIANEFKQLLRNEIIRKNEFKDVMLLGHIEELLKKHVGK